MLSGPLGFYLAFGGAEPTGGVHTDRSKPPGLLGLPKWIIKGMLLYHQLNESNSIFNFKNSAGNLSTSLLPDPSTS